MCVFHFIGIRRKTRREKKGEREDIRHKQRESWRERESVVYFTCFLARFYAKMTNYD